MLHIVRTDFDVRLGEEAEDLGQQIALGIIELHRPILAILAEGHFFRHPVHLLLDLPEVIRPRVTEGLVRPARGQQSGHIGISVSHQGLLRHLLRFLGQSTPYIVPH